MEKKTSELADYEKMIDRVHNSLVVCLTRDINTGNGTGEVNEAVMKQCIENLKGLASILEQTFICKS